MQEKFHRLKKMQFRYFLLNELDHASEQLYSIQTKI